MSRNDHSHSTDEYECEISFGGEADLGKLYAKCQKNPGHTKFIPFTNFSKKDLPDEYSNSDIVDLIRNLADLTTRIVTRHISEHRPEKWPGKETHYPFHHTSNMPDCIRTGTGVVDFIMEAFSPVHGKCPCHECIASGKSCDEWWKVRVNTATHVVYDTSEAKSTVIECFFNSNHDRATSVKNLYGLCVSENPGKVSSDWSVVECATHDKHLATHLMKLKLQRDEILDRIENSSSKDCVVVISHPHGCSKMISVGSLLSVTIPAWDHQQADWLPLKNKTFCRLPSVVAHKNLPMSRHLVRNFYCNITNTGLSYGNSIPLVPGAGFVIPEGTLFSLPPNAPFALRISSALGSKSYTFPANTRFVLSDGREFQLPPETQFFGPPVEDVVGILTYTTETCPGSSGACVLLLSQLSAFTRKAKQLSFCQIFTHSCSTSSGLSKSSTGIFKHLVAARSF